MDGRRGFILKICGEWIGEKRLKIAFQLYEMAINLSKQNIIESNPGITGKELKKKLFERFGYNTGRIASKDCF